MFGGSGSQRVFDLLLNQRRVKADVMVNELAKIRIACGNEDVVAALVTRVVHRVGEREEQFLLRRVEVIAERRAEDVGELGLGDGFAHGAPRFTKPPTALSSGRFSNFTGL